MINTNKKKLIEIIIFIIIMFVALYLNKDRLGINSFKLSGLIDGDFMTSNNNATLNNDDVSRIKADKSRIDKALQENKKLLEGDERFLNELRSYINLPMTEEEYNNFIGTVHNDYPFGNPISDKK